MLLNNIQNKTQTQIDSIQDQIDTLLQQQREWQAYLQKLGSVESVMASGLEQIRTAITLLHKFAPSELGNYQKAVNELFDLNHEPVLLGEHVVNQTNYVMADDGNGLIVNVEQGQFVGDNIPGDGNPDINNGDGEDIQQAINDLNWQSLIKML